MDKEKIIIQINEKLDEIRKGLGSPVIENISTIDLHIALRDLIFASKKINGESTVVNRKIRKL